MEKVNSSNPKPRRLKGQTWQVEEMMGIFLVILIFGGVVLVIIAGWGGLGNMLNDFCQKNPTWCGASKAADSDYRIAKASSDALFIAINCIANPADCRSDCSDSNGCTFDPNNLVIQAGLFGTVSASDQDDIVTLKCVEDAYYDVDDVYEFLPSSLDDAQSICNDWCTIEDKCEPTESRHVYLDELYRKDHVLGCSCSFLDDEGKLRTRIQKTYGFDIEDVISECREYFSDERWIILGSTPEPDDIYIGNCEEFSISEDSAAREFYDRKLEDSDSESYYTSGKECTCNLYENQGDTVPVTSYPVYGLDIESIHSPVVRCSKDQANMDSSGSKAEDYSLSGCKDFGGELIYYKEGDSGAQGPLLHKCQERTIDCTITNFQLPQEVSNADEWIGGFGDPLFLVYWQAFPPGEDADWEGMATWTKGLTTVTFGAMCIYGIIKGARGKYVAGKVALSTSKSRAVSWVSEKFKKSFSKLFGSGSTAATREFDDLIRFYETGSWTTASKLSVLKSKIPEIANKLSRKELSAAFTKFKAGAALRADYTATATALVSADAYVAKLIDHKFGKFFPEEEEADKIVLHKPLDKREMLDLEPRHPIMPEVTDPVHQDLIKMNKPVMLSKSGKFGIGEELKSFWLASPCRTNLKIDEDEIVCTAYEYDSASGLTRCDNPDEEGWFQGLDKDRLVGCGSLPDANRDDSIQLIREGDFIQDMDSITIFEDGVQTDTPDGSKPLYKIYDPINLITLYFDRTTQKIEYIKAGDGEIQEFEDPRAILGFGEHVCSVGTDNDPISSTVGLGEDDMFICKEIYIKKDLTDYEQTKYYIYGALDDESNLFKFTALRIDYYFYFYKIEKSIILEDMSEQEGSLSFNGKIDKVSDVVFGKTALGGLDIKYTRSFSDIDNDGVPDSVSSTNCKIDAVIVEPDMSPYDDEPNYCYKGKYSGYGDFAFTTGSILVSTAFKGKGWGALASTAADCVLAYYSARSNNQWPHRGSF